MRYDRRGWDEGKLHRYRHRHRYHHHPSPSNSHPNTIVQPDESWLIVPTQRLFRGQKEGRRHRQHHVQHVHTVHKKETKTIVYSVQQKHEHKHKHIIPVRIVLLHSIPEQSRAFFTCRVERTTARRLVLIAQRWMTRLAHFLLSSTIRFSLSDMDVLRNTCSSNPIQSKHRKQKMVCTAMAQKCRWHKNQVDHMVLVGPRDSTSTSTHGKYTLLALYMSPNNPTNYLSTAKLE